MTTAKQLARLLILSSIATAYAAPAESTDNYWLIMEVTGRWEYRLPDEKPRQLTGRYDAIRPEGQVRCMEPDLRRCELRYLTNARSQATERLNVRLLEPGGWVSLKTLKTVPAPVLPATASDLAKKFIRATSAGGSRAASGCGGDLPLRAPACGENIDLANFTIRWAPQVTGTVAVFLERVDGESARYRSNAQGAAGEFRDPELTAFLRRVQSQSEVVNISVRVMAEAGKEAHRLVHVPPSVRSDDYEDRLRAVGSGITVPVRVTRMSLALDEGMWSRAAEEASALIPLAAGAVPTLEYAVVGICNSDFAEEKAVLKRQLRGATYDEVCATGSPTDPPSPAVTAAPPPPAPDITEGADPAAKTRTGVALLIGNYDYWNTPLNSVKGDLDKMQETLRSLGFAVTVKENLRTPRQFVDALDETIRREAASPDDVLLLYYSGHGLQLDGKAQLLSTGVSANARVAEDLRDNAQSAQELLEQMERAVPGTRILIVEACRNDPLGSSAEASAAKGGFAFQQDDVPNTFVMFANKPGATTPVRSDYGLMGPFTEALVHALQTSSTGEILDVYSAAAKKTMEISPTQEPVLYHSKSIRSVILRRDSTVVQDGRAKELLNSAETTYHSRAWHEFHATVSRAKALASDAALRDRLSRESEFAQSVMRAEAAESLRNWQDAAASWQEAGQLFPVREWVSMRAGVAWLLGDELLKGARALATLGGQSNSEAATKARQLVSELTKQFPSLATECEVAARQAKKTSGEPEFLRIGDKEK